MLHDLIDPHPELRVGSPLPHVRHASQVGGRWQHLGQLLWGFIHQVAPEWTKQIK